MKATLEFSGLTLELHPERLLWVPTLKLLCVSDLHFEKGSFFEQFATLLPPYDSLDMLERLDLAITHFRPEIFIALGDSFHDRKAGERMEASLKTTLNTLIASVKRWVWIMGNHDPQIDTSIAGERLKELHIANTCFRHELDAAYDGFEISGHFHPKLSVRLRGHSIGGPCFLHSANRLIMPAFGGYTGGLSVASPEFLNALPKPITRLYLSHRGIVHPLSPAILE